MSDPAVWLSCLAVGVVLSAALAPSSVLRQFARAIVGQRAPHVWWPSVAAVLAPAALAGLAVATARLAATNWPGSLLTYTTTRASIPYLTAEFFWILLSYVPFVAAWYGFAADRLARRLPPLAVGMVIGLVGVALPDQFLRHLVWSHLRAFSPSGGPLTSAYSVAVAVTGLWLLERARGGLLPALLFVASTPIALEAALHWGGPTIVATNNAGRLYCWLMIVLAMLAAIGSQMWRRQAGASAGARKPLSDAALARTSGVVLAIAAAVWCALVIMLELELLSSRVKTYSRGDFLAAAFLACVGFVGLWIVLMWTTATVMRGTFHLPVKWPWRRRPPQAR
jgi:hypothetical protein